MRFFRCLKIIFLSLLGFNCGVMFGLMCGIPMLFLVDQVFISLINTSIVSAFVDCITWCLQKPGIFTTIIILLDISGTCWFAYNWLKPNSR